MKKTKQLTAVLLSLVMLLALAVPASAAEITPSPSQTTKPATPMKLTRSSPACVR